MTASLAASVLEAKKHALRQLQSGEWVVSLTVHPNDALPWWLISAKPGQRVALTVALLNEAPEPESPKAAGGHARAAALTPEQRTDIARKAAETRWEKPKTAFLDLPLSQQAALLCQRTDFQLWASKQLLSAGGGRIDNTNDCAGWLRMRLGIESRADLDKPVPARSTFMQMVEQYRFEMGLEARP